MIEAKKKESHTPEFMAKVGLVALQGEMWPPPIISRVPNTVGFISWQYNLIRQQ